MKKGIAFAIFVTFLFYSFANASLRKKRLILHSSEDVFNEIQNLKLENANMKASLDSLSKGKCAFMNI